MIYNFGQLILKATYYDGYWLILFVVLSFYVARNTDRYRFDNVYYESPYKSPALKLPIILWSNGTFQSYELPTFVQCGTNRCDVLPYTKQQSVKDVLAAYIFHPYKRAWHDFPLLPRNPSIILWGALLEESPVYCIECMHRNLITQFNYSSTFSRYSDVPFTLRYIVSLNNITSKIYYVETANKNALLKDISPILYIQSNCITTTERDIYVEKLMKLQSIDSYGGCVNNKKLFTEHEYVYEYMLHLQSAEQRSFIARYKFIIAIENSVCEDYVTEKLWRAIHAGVVPIYFGSPSVRDWLPNIKSAILLQDYPTPELLSEHINELMANDDLYEEYLEHKTKGIISNKYLIEEIKARPYQTNLPNIMGEFSCLLCNKLHESKIRPLPHRVINGSHFNCPLPITALSLNTNPVTKFTKFVLALFAETGRRYNDDLSDLKWREL